jgi:HD-GYP domain-containing protein (c-di-GMP phosphodiesterase class II)
MTILPGMGCHMFQNARPHPCGAGPQAPGPEAVVGRWLRTLQVHDPETVGHCWRVRRHALRLAGALGLGRGACRQLALAAVLHDVGKLEVPLAVLQKPGRLTAEESLRVQRHPAAGVRLLAADVRDPVVLAAIRHHHERHDGAGYPDRLRGERIPLLARILALADCYDAMRSDRPYRPGLSRAAALAAVHHGAGAQFDPRLTAAFLVLEEGPAQACV